MRRIAWCSLWCSFVSEVSAVVSASSPLFAAICRDLQSKRAESEKRNAKGRRKILAEVTVFKALTASVSKVSPRGSNL